MIIENGTICNGEEIESYRGFVLCSSKKNSPGGLDKYIFVFKNKHFTITYPNKTVIEIKYNEILPDVVEDDIEILQYSRVAKFKIENWKPLRANIIRQLRREIRLSRIHDN